MSEPKIKNEEQGPVYILTINRPESLNALNKDVFDELDLFFTNNKDNFKIRGVIITGSGSKAFLAGGDIKEFAALDAESGGKVIQAGSGCFL